MGSSIRIEMNSAGIRELLRSAGVRADLARRARAIAAAAGEGMEVREELRRDRARASVFTATKEARIAEASTRSLTRALDAGRP
jgi:hypothetical protein